MGQEFWRAVQPGVLPLLDGAAKMHGVPIDDDGGEQIEAGDPVVLSFTRPVADLTLAADAQGILQGMMRLALVEPDLGAALHVGVKQPFDDEECPFDPSDFPECDRQVVLPRIGCKFP